MDWREVFAVYTGSLELKSMELNDSITGGWISDAFHSLQSREYKATTNENISTTVSEFNALSTRNSEVLVCRYNSRLAAA